MDVRLGSLSNVSGPACHLTILLKIFSSEENALLFTQSALLQCDTFFSLWTAKEAYIKATGRSILTVLKQLYFSAITSGVEKTRDSNVCIFRVKQTT